MSGSNHQPGSQDSRHIDRLDFDANRGAVRSRSSRGGMRSLLDEDVDFMSEVAEENVHLNISRTALYISSFIARCSIGCLLILIEPPAMDLLETLTINSRLLMIAVPVARAFDTFWDGVLGLCIPVMLSPEDISSSSGKHRRIVVYSRWLLLGPSELLAYGCFSDSSHQRLVSSPRRDGRRVSQKSS